MSIFVLLNQDNCPIGLHCEQLNPKRRYVVAKKHLTKRANNSWVAL